MIKNHKSAFDKRVDERPGGIHGAIWCVVAGIGYGVTNIFNKEAYERGLSVAQFLFLRHIVLLVGSMLLGHFCRGVNFDLRVYERDHLKIPFYRSILAIFAKLMAYSSVAMIPLTMSSCIQFVTAPMFAALVALICICEKLSCADTASVAVSLLGVLMVTMPQMFSFLHLDKDGVQTRLSEEISKYGKVTYYAGILVGLGAIFMDQVTHFIIRTMGAKTKLPPSLVTFFQGLTISTVTFVYLIIWERHEVANMKLDAFFFAFLAALTSWLAQECLVLGVTVSKSALATYGFQSGIVVPVVYDAFIAKTHPLYIVDSIGLLLIIILQIFNIVKSLMKKKVTEDDAAEVQGNGEKNTVQMQQLPNDSMSTETTDKEME